MFRLTMFQGEDFSTLGLFTTKALAESAKCEMINLMKSSKNCFPSEDHFFIKKISEQINIDDQFTKCMIVFTADVVLGGIITNAIYIASGKKDADSYMKAWRKHNKDRETTIFAKNCILNKLYTTSIDCNIDSD